MKIGYWLGNANISGGGTAPYAWRVLESLLKRSQVQEIEILILCSAEVERDCLNLIDKYQAKAKLHLIPQKFNVIKRIVSRFSGLISKVCLRFNIPSKKLKQFNHWFRWFSSLDIDLLHVPYQTFVYYDLPYPLIVTMHDVQELHYPEFFTPQQRAWRAKVYWQALEKSSAIIVSFNHVKQDLIKYFRLPDNKVSVCPLPFSNSYLQPSSYDEELEYQNKYAKWENFLLYPAQTWQHKNHLSLIKAIELIKNKLGRTIHLICTGKKYEGFFPTIEEYFKTSSVLDQIHFMDIVPEPELYWLYKNSSLIVIPTLYEAGSFPLIEAMYLETPVICSSVTSLPETIGDLRFTFNPLDINQISNLIIDLLDNPELREENIQNSRNRIEEMKNIDSAFHLFEMYSKMLSLK